MSEPEKIAGRTQIELCTTDVCPGNLFGKIASKARIPFSACLWHQDLDEILQNRKNPTTSAAYPWSLT
jgi:hypothetical protein